MKDDSTTAIKKVMLLVCVSNVDFDQDNHNQSKIDENNLISTNIVERNSHFLLGCPP